MHKGEVAVVDKEMGVAPTGVVAIEVGHVVGEQLAADHNADHFVGVVGIPLLESPFILREA